MPGRRPRPVRGRVEAPVAAVRAQRAQHPPPAVPATPRGNTLMLIGALLAGAWIERIVYGLPTLLANGFDIALVVASAVVVMLAYRRAVRRRLERVRGGPAASLRVPRPRTDETTSLRPPAAVE